MKRVLGHVLAGGTVLAAGMALVVACKHDDSTLFVQDVLAPPLVTTGQTCTFTADPTQPTLSSGVLDYGLKQAYDANFLVGNQAVAKVNSQQLQTETDIITIQGAIVRITDSSGNQIGNYTRLAGATVYPSTGTTPGYAAITGVTIVDSGSLAADSALQTNIMAGGLSRVVTYTKFFGQTTGGTYVESDEFEFPVDVCYGCLVAYSATDQNPLAQTPNCLDYATAAQSGTSTPQSCIPGQDFAIDCAECQALPVCRGAYANQPTPVFTDAGPG